MAITDRRGVSVDATDTAIAGDPNPGLAIKAPVRAATTANITLSGLQTIDSVVLAAGDRVLVKSQTDATTNGIYNVSTGLWQRSVDANSNTEWTTGTQIVVTNGTLYTNNTFILTAALPITLGSSSLTFVAVAVPSTRLLTSTAPIAVNGARSASLATDVAFTLDTNGITAALFRQSAGLSVVGNATNATANVADITAASDNQVFRRSGTALAFGAVLLSSASAVSGVLAVANGGTNGSSASGTLLDNITGFASTGLLARTASGTYAFRTITGTSNRLSVTNGDGVSGNPTLDISTSYVGQATITTLGTIATGVWNGTVITGTYGGTGVNNGASTITIGGNVVHSGAFTTTITVTATTNSTLPAGTHTLAGLDVAQTWSANQQFNSGNFLLKGATSGTITLNAAATAGSNTITLPAGTTDFSATGGTSQVVKQTSAGGAFTVAQLAASDLSNGTTGSGAVVLAASPTFSGTVAGANTIPYSVLQQAAGLTLLGVTGSATANIAAITGTANQIPIVNSAGTSLVFTTVSGDLTNAAGAFTIANNAVTNAKAAQAAAYTFKGNATGSTANVTDFTIAGLTHKASPTSSDLLVISDAAASNATKYCTVGEAIAAVTSGVTSIAGNTGAFTLSTGITNSTNDIRLVVPVTVALGGTGDTGTAWTTYSPVPTAQTGSFTTVSSSGAYKTLGKTVWFTITITITSAGTAAGFIQVALPTGTTKREACGDAIETANSGLRGGWFAGASGTTMNIAKYDNTTLIGTGNVVTASGVYEIT